MDEKNIALFASVAAGLVTAGGQVAQQKKWPQSTILIGTFGLAFITSAVAEVAPKLAATAALTILATAVFAVSDAPFTAVSNIAKPRP